jgi:hypothetical protein
MGSGLFYRTGDEVMLGDRVRMRRWFRRSLDCVVCYIPGVSPKHPEMEYADVRQWAVRAKDGAVYPILYDPDTFQPPSSIQFVGRGDKGLLIPEETLV